MNHTGTHDRETEFILRFVIFDFQRSAAELAALLNVAPAYVRTRHGPPPSPGRRMPRSLFTRVGRSTGSLMMNRHLLRFLDALEPLPSRVQELADQHDVEISISCHINDYGKEYVIYCDPLLVRRLARMGASLEVVVHPGTDPASTMAEDLELGYLPEDD